MNVLAQLNIGRLKLEDFAKLMNGKVIKKELIELPFRFGDADSTHIMVYMIKKGIMTFICGSYFTDRFGNMDKKGSMLSSEVKNIKKAQKTYDSYKTANVEMIEDMILKNEGEEELEKYRQGLKKAY